MPVADSVDELLRPLIDSLGVELIDVEWVGSSLRVVVDEGEGITTDRLTEVNRLISPILDQHDPVPGRYTLEVSSPGVERKLTRPTHFTRAIGEDVVVKLSTGNEPRRIKGKLDAFDPDAGLLTVSAIELDGVDLAEPESHDITLEIIDKARTVYNWGPSPKPGGKQPGNKQSAKKQTAKKAPADQASAKKQAAKKQQPKKKRPKQHPELDDPPITSEPA